MGYYIGRSSSQRNNQGFNIGPPVLVLFGQHASPNTSMALLLSEVNLPFGYIGTDISIERDQEACSPSSAWLVSPLDMVARSIPSNRRMS